MALRPSGTDGADHVHRMVIEDRYKRLAFLRRHAGLQVRAAAALVAARSAWRALPALAGRGPLSRVDAAVAAIGTAVFWLHRAAFGRRERPGPQMLVSVGLLVLLAEVFISAYTYHVLDGASSPSAAARAAYPAIPALAARALRRRLRLVGRPAVLLRRFLAYAEVAVDAALMAVAALGVLTTRQYVMEARHKGREVSQREIECALEERAEAEKKRAAAAARRKAD